MAWLIFRVETHLYLAYLADLVCICIMIHHVLLIISNKTSNKSPYLHLL